MLWLIEGTYIIYMVTWGETESGENNNFMQKFEQNDILVNIICSIYLSIYLSINLSIYLFCNIYCKSIRPMPLSRG